MRVYQTILILICTTCSEAHSWHYLWFKIWVGEYYSSSLPVGPGGSLSRWEELWLCKPADLRPSEFVILIQQVHRAWPSYCEVVALLLPMGFSFLPKDIQSVGDETCSKL